MINMNEINLVPKEYRKKTLKFSGIFSKIGGIFLILLILSLLLFGGLFIYKKSLNKELSDFKKEILILDQKRNPELEEKIVNLDKKLEILESIFNNHLYWSELFTRIENLVLKKAYFSKVRIGFLETDLAINLSGNALTYTILAQQMLSFQEDSSVKSVQVSDISLGSEGGIDFNLQIIFSKNILIND